MPRTARCCGRQGLLTRGAASSTVMSLVTPLFAQRERRSQPDRTATDDQHFHGNAASSTTPLACAGCLDLGHRLRRFDREILVAARRDQHVVFDAPPMFQKCSGTSASGRMYRPGSLVSTMPGLRSARCPFAIVTGIVHVHADPVARAVHIKLGVGLFLNDLIERAPLSRPRSSMRCESTRMATS